MNGLTLSLKQFNKELEKLIADKISGSADILFSLNNLFEKNFDRIDDFIPVINNLKKEFRTFQNIRHYLINVKALAEKGTLTKQFFKSYLSSAEDTQHEIFEHAFPFLKGKKKILTLSNSGTVFEFLKLMKKSKKNISVVVCESRPKLEGRILAKKLTDKNIKVTIITEAMLAQYIPKCDCALIGADAVLKNKSVVNKIGSLQTAILCRYFKKPFYVAADKSKFTSVSNANQRVHDDKEIWGKMPQGIKTENFYFEVVPKELITKIFTD